MKVLVTAAGGALAPMNIMLLQGGRRRSEVLAVDARADAAGRHFADAFATVPPGSDPGYVDAVIGLVQGQSVDVVLPWSDEEALALAARRDEVEAAGATLAVAETEALRTMSDKAATYRLLAAAGIPTARWRRVNDPEALTEELDALRAERGEAVVKPMVARGNRGTYVIRSDIGAAAEYLGSRELHVGWDEFQRTCLPDLVPRLPVIVMERLVEPAIDIDILAHEGNLVHAIPRERVNPAGVPYHGSIFRSAPALLELADRVTRAFGLSWLYDYDVMYRRDGTPVILEVNPRPSGSIAASVANGIPLYDDLFDLIDGKPVAPARQPADGTLSVPYLAIRTASH